MPTFHKVSTFRERFIDLCNSESISDSRLAEKLGVSKQTVSAWKSGTRSPKEPTIIAIASYFHVNVRWLMGFNVEKGERKIRYATDPMTPRLNVRDKDDHSFVHAALQASVESKPEVSYDYVQPDVIDMGIAPEEKAILYRVVGKLAKTNPESAVKLLSILSEEDLL